MDLPDCGGAVSADLIRDEGRHDLLEFASIGVNGGRIVFSVA